MDKARIREKLDAKRERLSAYLDREVEMLRGGVQSYGIGSRNLTRYQTDLANIRAAITELDKEIEQLENQLSGRASRRAIGVVPRDW